MRRFFLSTIVFFTQVLIADAQLIPSYVETEPNNNFATANHLPYDTLNEAGVGNADAIDFHKINFPYNYNFYLLVEATNKGNGDAFLKMDMYDGRETGGLFFTKNIGNTTAISPGTTVIDTIYLCGRAIDNYFLAFSTNDTFNYLMRWLPVNSYSDDEPNNTPATANGFPMNFSKEGSVNYTFQGTPAGGEDWFTSYALPSANYTDMKLYLRGRNNSCGGGTKWLYYQVYKNDTFNLVDQDYVGSTLGADPFEDITSVIPMNTFQEGDVLYIRLSSNAPFGYSMLYSELASFDDVEDNCCIDNALPLEENQVAGGHVGEYDVSNDVYIDQYDTYRIILPHDGAINLQVAAANAECGLEALLLNYDLLDKYGNEFCSNQLVSWSGNPPCNTLMFDTVKIRGIAGDTVYLRLSSYSGWSPTSSVVVNYNIKYQYTDSTGSDPEFNNDSTTAIQINTGEIVKGHVGFFTADDYTADYTDFYKTNLPADGKIKLYIKTKFRQHFDNSYSVLAFKYVNNNQTVEVPIPFPPPDELNTDTAIICAVTAGTAYFQIYTGPYSEAYEYEFYYELLDTSTWANDIEYNNNFTQPQPIMQAETKTGRLYYRQDDFLYNPDRFDYYRTVLPTDGTVKLFVEATNTGCNTSNYSLQLTGYDRRKASGILFTKNIGNLSTVAPGIPIYDTITLCGRAADTMFFRFEAFETFRYKIRYEISDTSTNDIEPNGTFAEALLIGGSQTKKGHIRYALNGTNDIFDYYMLTFGSNDSLKLNVQGTNMFCAANQFLRFELYNKNKTQILSRNIGNTNAVAAGQTVFDTLRIGVIAPDTIYIRVDASNAFKYQFTTNALKPTSGFSITGDTTACLGTQIYQAINVRETDVSYNWSLPSGGGSISNTDSIATVNWTNTGNRVVQLIISNSAGASQPRILHVIVNGNAPTQVPVAYNFARTLSTNTIPPGGSCQWFKNNILIPGAIDSVYYAADAGSYTVKFVNDCGTGPASNAIVFATAAQVQTITFLHVPAISMSPTAKAILTATSSSFLPVFYQKISGSGFISNDTLYATSTGTIIVKAMQPGDDVYRAAPDQYDTIIVLKGNQVISFDSIPNQIFDANKITMVASSSMGQTISYSIITGGTYASVSGNLVTKKGAGTVTVRASQTGNSNYNAATPVDRTFCIGVRTIAPVTGEVSPCLATYRYNTQKIPGANFTWTLSGGGILTTNNDTAWVQWQTPGTYTLTVKANSPCDPVYSDLQQYTITTSNNIPGIISGMLPANNAIDQQLPLTLSWVPGNNTVNYDLYLWDSAAIEPVTPYAANINNIQYVIPKNSGLPYNRTYKWKIIAKNPCSQTTGPVQQFKLIPLPDLVVSDVLAPATANSGQTITISWKVTNIGPGRTLTSDTWYDGVYFALDTVPNISFDGSPNWNPTSWNSLTANGRPLLLGTKQRPSSLDSGQFYTNTLDFTLPLNYSFPVYVYVITDNQHPNWKILQVSVANDTARKQNPVNISLAPTPDIRVDSVFAPASTFSGSAINLTYKVKNYGVVTPAGASWNDAVYMSQSPLFDSSTAIRLNAVKSNGSYYPSGGYAGATVNNQLQPDSFYTRNVQVIVPNFIFGTWFFYVKANNNKILYEGALSNNNINQAQVQVYLTPTPKLTVNSLSVPVTTASTTQPIGINWNIFNEGFTDNIEKNKGHYLLRKIGICSCSIPPGSPPGTTCIPPPKYFDSLAQGSSYWVDRVYISTDSMGLNLSNAILLQEVAHGTQYSALFYPDNMTGCDYTGAINVSQVIKPGSNFPQSLNFNIPSNLQPGNYYVYVYTNPTKTVFEYPGTAQIKRSILPITVQRPDAVVSAISVPANSIGGTTVTINYSVLNNGPGAVFSHARKDRLYISNFSSFDVSAQVVGTQTFTESLPVGTTVPHTFTYNLPPSTNGAKYFYIQTNYDSLFKETNSVNNTSISAVTIISAALPADLVVSSVQPKDTVFTVLPTLFKYTVANNGTGSTAGTWTDSLFISCSPVFSAATSYFVTKRTQTRIVTAGSNYTDSFSLTIPKMSYEINACFPQEAHAPGYFYVKTNSDNGTYEASATNNNITGSGTRIILNPLVDQIVTAVSGPDTATVGLAYPANWRIKNIGYNPNRMQYYYWWQDAIYFSADSIADAADTKAGEYLKYILLNRNQDSADSRSPLTPTLLTGDYYVYVKTNSTDAIPAEKILSNNVNFIRNASGAAKKVHVIRPALADLTDTIITAPVSVAAGQPITVIYKIINNGTGVTYPGTSWQNTLRLSEDFFANPNDGDRLLATRNRNGVLMPGQFYFDTVTVTIPPATVPGNYVLISKANSSADVVESNSNNNLGFSLLNVFAPPVTDLTVINIMRPDSVYLGYTIDTARWVIANTSGEEARGYSSDGIYLSAGNLFDSTAILIGIKNKNINMQPLQTDTVKMAPLVTGVAEGNYNLFVKTDLLNNILESDKHNNVGMSATPIYVKVKELPLNIATAATLQSISRFYKLKIPDSLRGSTILVILKSSDSLSVRNEMFIRGSFVPTPAQYDYRFEIPNYGNQQIVMTDVTDTVYYLMVRCVSPNPVLQNIQLKAVKLPFAILNVHTNSGGNIGNVTIRINGSLFRDSMTAKLSNGVTVIQASSVYFTNSTQVFATFNLQGKPLGIYDVTLVKPDLSTAVLPNGFSVVPPNNGGLITGGGVNTGAGNGNEPGCDPGAASGLNSQLVVDLVVPARVLLKRPVVILINFSNPTNFDIPAQSRILYSEAGMKMAFTKEGAPFGTTSLYLELVEPGGPPGIIRAGGSGTIIVHTKAPELMPDPNFVLFKLK